MGVDMKEVQEVLRGQGVKADREPLPPLTASADETTYYTKPNQMVCISFSDLCVNLSHFMCESVHLLPFRLTDG